LGALLCACPDDPVAPPDAGGGAPDAGAADAEPADMGVELTEVCPRAPDFVANADVNGDGVFDIADPIALENHLFRAGPAPACRAAADFNGDGRVEADDATRMTSYLVTGAQTLRDLPPGACDSAVPWPEGQCTPLAIELSGPSRTDTSAVVTASIRSPTLQVQGWSTSVTADGCTIAGITTERTTAAEVWDDPPGIRHLGYAATTQVTGGAVSYVILSLTEDIFLPATTDPVSVLGIELLDETQHTGCIPCTVRLGDGLAWQGQPIALTISAEGRSYKPPAPELTIEFCQ
jgi:hypothetical protein